MVQSWWKVAITSDLADGGRLHTCVNGRYITLFRQRNVLSAIDAVCHHAGGPLTIGRIQDIEDLNMTVVLCPWHKFMVSIHTGEKAYQSVAIENGKPVPSGWKKGQVVQRAHEVLERKNCIYVRLCLPLGDTASSSCDGDCTGDIPSTCASDKDAYKEACMRDYPMHSTAAQEMTKGIP